MSASVPGVPQGLRVVGQTLAEVGEGPVWDSQRDRLWWVDLLAGLIHLTDTRTGATTTVSCGQPVGAVALRRSGGLVTADLAGFSYLDDKGRIVERMPFLPDGHRMNDAKVDPMGRFWPGSNEMNFAAGKGSLHVLDTDGSHRQVLDGLTLPNGLGWSRDASTFYLIDSEQHWLRAWSYGQASGELGAVRELVRFPVEDEVPDGMCVDSEDAIWVAIWGGWRVERYSPEGELLKTLSLPAAQPSSCAFGGPEFGTLFVTSAYRGLANRRSPLDGALFAVNSPGVTGAPAAAFDG
jgi:sugar lactone lactonase YvrE